LEPDLGGSESASAASINNICVLFTIQFAYKLGGSTLAIGY